MRRYPKAGGQFAIIWVDLLYEDSVPATGKLLFGEIYRLSDADGFCFASNKDFMELLGCSESTVRNLLRALEDVGQIRCENRPKRDGSGGTERRIFCGRKLAPPVDSGYPQKIDGTPRKKLGEVPTENCGSTYHKNNKNNIPPISPIAPAEVWSAINDYIGDDAEYLAAFEDFLRNRKAMKKPVLTARAIKTTINRLRKVNHRETEICMLTVAVEKNWLTVYPLRPDELPKSARTGSTRVVEEEGVRYV